MMEQDFSKRPISIAIIGWIFVAAGVVGLAEAVSEFGMHDPGLDLLLHVVLPIIAAAGGAFLLRRAGWARWLLIAWMVYHVALGVLHSFAAAAVHGVLLAAILYLLFRPPASEYFGRTGGTLRPA